MPRVLRRLQLVEHLRLDGDVERGGRLVGDHQLRVERDRRGDQRALAQAAGELVGPLLGADLGLGTPTGRAARSPAPGARPGAPAVQLAAPRRSPSPTGRSWSSETSASCRMKPTSWPRRPTPVAVLERRAGRAPSKLDPVGADVRLAAGQPDQGAGGDALARAGLADDRQALARGQGEGDAVDDLGDVALRRRSRPAGSRTRRRSCSGSSSRGSSAVLSFVVVLIG